MKVKSSWREARSEISSLVRAEKCPAGMIQRLIDPGIGLDRVKLLWVHALFRHREASGLANKAALASAVPSLDDEEGAEGLLVEVYEACSQDYRLSLSTLETALCYRLHRESKLPDKRIAETLGLGTKDNPNAKRVRQAVERCEQVSKGVPAPKPTPITAPVLLKVGLLTSESGPMEGAEYCVREGFKLALSDAKPALEKVGVVVEDLKEDGESLDTAFADGARRLLDQGVYTIFGCWTSASRKAVLTVLREAGRGLLVYPIQFEGVEISDQVIYLGMAPNQQLVPLVEYSVGGLKARTFALVGSDYIYPATAHEILADEIGSHPGCSIVYRSLYSLTLGPKEEDIDALLAHEPDVIVNCINGDSNRRFFELLHRKADRAAKPPRVISVSCSARDFKRYGASTVGHYAAWSYFEEVRGAENQAFIRDVRERLPDIRISDPFATTYEGVRLWARRLIELRQQQPQMGAVDLQKLVWPSMQGVEIQTPAGPITFDGRGYTARVSRIAEHRGDGLFSLVYSTESPIEPEPFPRFRSQGQWTGFVDGLFETWGGRWQADD